MCSLVEQQLSIILIINIDNTKWVGAITNVKSLCKLHIVYTDTLYVFILNWYILSNLFAQVYSWTIDK